MRVTIDSGALEALLKVMLTVARTNGVEALLEMDPEIVEKLKRADLDFGTEPCQIIDGKVPELSIYRMLDDLLAMFGSARSVTPEREYHLAAA